MKFLFIFITGCLTFLSACGGNNNASTTNNSLDSISDAIDWEIKEEKQKDKDSAKFTKEDWQIFELALTNTFKADIYEAYMPYELMLDSNTTYNLAETNEFLYWFKGLKNEHGIDQLTTAISALSFNQADSLQLLVTSFITVVKSSNKTVIGEALANNIKYLLSSKAVTPKFIINGITKTLGQHNFDRKLCRLSAFCYLISMLQISPI